MWYLPNAIDMTHFRPAEPGERDRLRRELGLPADRVICLFVGRLSREKGVMDLLEAWRLLQPSDALLVVAGPDMTGHAWDAGAPGRAFVAAHGLGERVRFVGPLTDVAPMIRASDLVVQPSHFEALGLSAIEALACGVPLVASASAACSISSSTAKTAGCRPPEDPAALAAVHRPAARRRRGSAAALPRAPAHRCWRTTTSRSCSAGCARCSIAWRRPAMSASSSRLSFLRSSGYATITAGSAVLLVALTMIAGRWLPASEYGKFSFAIALATIVETLMDIGLGPVTVRTVARDGEGAGTLFRHVLGLKIAWGALGLVGAADRRAAHAPATRR